MKESRNRDKERKNRKKKAKQRKWEQILNEGCTFFKKVVDD